MKTLKEVEAIVRKEKVAPLVDALRDAGVTRLWVSHVHSFGSGVDPEEFRVSSEEGGSYMEKARIEFLVSEAEVEEMLQIIRERGSAGHRGDGLIVIRDVGEVVNVRTGDRDRLALL